MDEIYRTYWRCKSCGNRWSYDCNLAGFNCRCPACGNMTNPKTWECIRSIKVPWVGGDG